MRFSSSQRPPHHYSTCPHDSINQRGICKGCGTRQKPFTPRPPEPSRPARLVEDDDDFEEVFWSFVKKGAADECWEWQGGSKRAGYGAFQGEAAHRLAFELTTGQEPGDLFVCHKCDNPPCCNPDHLFLGTHQDNMRDMVSKGRHKGGRKKKVA